MKLRAILERAALGDPPPADGAVQVLPRPAGVVAAVLAFTAHHVVAADVDPGWVAERLAPWDLEAPFGPRFLSELAVVVGAPAGTLDVVLVAPPARPGTTLRPLAPSETAALLGDGPHPRREATGYRSDDGAGTLLLGRGLAGRWEIRFEVAPEARNRGIGRMLAAAAPALVPGDAPVFAQVAPGNVASLRALLAVGYRPVGAEVLFLAAGDGR